MENQGKRLLLAVGLALVVMLGWNMIFPPDKDPPPKPAAGSASGAPETPLAPAIVAGPKATTPTTPVAPSTQTPTAPSGPSSSTPPSTPPSAPTLNAEAPETPAQPPIVVTTPKFTATFTDVNGALTSWQLTDPRFERDATRGELMSATCKNGKASSTSDGSGCTENGRAKHPSTGAFIVSFPDAFPLDPRVRWVGKAIEKDRIVQYTYSDPRFDIEKTYTIYPDAYLVKMGVKVTPKIPKEQAKRAQLSVTFYAIQDPKADDEGSSQVSARIWQSSTMRDGSIYHTPIKQLIKSPRHEVNVQWTGFEHPYLLAGYAPNRQGSEVIEKKTYAGSSLGMPGTDDLMRTDMVFPSYPFEAGKPFTVEVVGFLGPKNYKELERADEAAGFTLGFTDTIDFGWFGIIGKPLLWLMLKFYALVGNWGIAIIMLTFLVKLLTLYWTTKSMRSMKAMASLAPQMKLIQEKYKDDRPRQQAETMALYKQHGVNPIAGCLPILLQMPVWIALYRMLSSAGELYQAPFIPGWINDLTDTDPYYILPIVLMVTMFVQARLQPVTGDSRQQKFLQYGMPLMFGVMSFFFPSGLTVYIFTNTVLSALHSIWMNKYDKKSIALVEQMKKNSEAMKAAAEAAKAPAKSTAKGPSKNGKAVQKPVIDVESTEAVGSAADNDDEDDAESPASTTPASTQPRPNVSRAKRKKRRR